MIQQKKNLIIITGLSGSGKTFALHTFEDLGYYCIDNLPVVLIPTFLNLINRTNVDINSTAIICDIREKRFLQNFKDTYYNLKKKKDLEVFLLFLESSIEVIIRRYSETRRRHPLEDEPSLSNRIEKEIGLMAEIRQMADVIIDTSEFNVHQLRSYIFRRFTLEDQEKGKLNISITSFGFKHGHPSDADILFDVRFLPNPFFNDKLKDKNGLDDNVAVFVQGSGEYKDFFPRFSQLLNLLIPYYKVEGKSYLNIAIGCTGGRHRSVVIAEDLYRNLKDSGHDVIINHRDINLIG